MCTFSCLSVTVHEIQIQRQTDEQWSGTNKDASSLYWMWKIIKKTRNYIKKRLINNIGTNIIKSLNSEAIHDCVINLPTVVKIPKSINIYNDNKYTLKKLVTWL